MKAPITHKVALFQDMKYTWMAPSVYTNDLEPHLLADITRVSEYVKVTFIPRPAEQIVPAQVAAVDKQIADITATFTKSLAELQDKKAQLLALTDQRGVA